MYVLLGYGCQGCSASGGLWHTTEHESASTGIGLNHYYIYTSMYCIQNPSYVDEQGEEVWHPEHMCSLVPGNKSVMIRSRSSVHQKKTAVAQ